MKRAFATSKATIRSLLSLTDPQFFRKSFFITGIIIIFMAPSLLATGIIRGKVFDNNTKEGLPAANIMIRGTSIGTVADLDGRYYIPNAPSGRQTLVVSFIGYGTKSEVVDIPEDGYLRKDFGLEVVALKGKDVTITAQALGQQQAIAQQLASNKIASVVSEARIQELPDFNAAQALSRLAGVSTLESSGEANKVVIRGLAPQFNTVSVEGVKLASTGSSQMGVSALGNTAGSISNDRSVDLTMVSPYMIKSISVYKSLTPDMNANSIGGSVNMELREAPSGLRYDALWQSGYTAKTDYYGNYRTVASVSQRFLNDKLGVYLLGNVERYDRDDDNMNANYKTTSTEVDPVTGFRPVSVTRVTLNRHVETRQRFGGNLILDYRLHSGSIKLVNMYTRLKSDFIDNRTVLNYLDKMLNFTYREGANTTDLAVNSLEFKYNLKPLQMDFKVANTSSKNNLPESPFVEFKTGQVSDRKTDVPWNTVPESLKTEWQYPGPDQAWLDNINLFSSLYKENKNTVTTNFKVPFRFGSILSGYLKIGGDYYRQKNSNDQKTPYASIRSSGDFQTAMVNDLSNRFGISVDPATAKFTASNFMGDPDLLRPFLNDRFGSIYWACDPTILAEMAYYLDGSPQWRGKATGGADVTGGWYNGMFQNLANTYEYIEDYYASYLMSELNFKNMLLVGGARYEKTLSKYTAYNMYDMRNPDAQNCDTVVVRPENEYWLPMVQAKYSPHYWLDIRYAYTQTLARPDYHQMSPKLNYDNSRKNIRSGNPDLVPAHAFNHDFNITFHGNKLGLFSLGAFYKTIKDFTYYTTYKLHKTAVSEYVKTIYDFDIMGIKPEDGATLYTYLNSPYPAYVKGLELDFQTRLWYLPFGLDGIVLGINYTKIESKATYPLRDDITVYPPRPNPPITTTYDSTRTGRLIYQPNDLMNAYVGYELKGFSARLSFLFQGNSVTYVGAFPEQDGYTKDYFRIDASVRQTLPFWGMEIYLDINNLNNEKNSSAQTTIDGFTNVKHYGMTANLGVRFK
ncbi:carboxypeptidase-like regulatory domain-containing protein [candidate division KSB1 bacterium]|nr:carboxypeptidase-like regulatory domain-containing protein [candidate division KSB1 bacterium]